MTWVRLDDAFADHPKVVGLSAAAFRLHVTALCYAARQETDGAIPHRAPFIVKRAATELVAAGLWEELPDGWLIHDYLDFNPSHAELDSKRDSKRMAGAKGAASRWHNTPDGPVPDPYPTRIEAAARETNPDWQRAVNAWERQSPGSINPVILDALDSWLRDGFPVDWVEKACEAAGQAGGRKPVAFVLAVLRRYRAQGSAGDKRQSDEANRLAAHEAELARARAAEVRT